MESSILINMLELHHTVLQDWAHTWLDTGMRTVYITDATGERLAEWPAFSKAGEADVSAPLQLGETRIGQLHLCGKIDVDMAAQLAADARLISDIILLEYEVEKMTTDFIDQQDQLMALHQLAQTARVYSGIRQNLTDLARITAQLLKTEYAFMVLQTQNHPPLPVMYPPREWPPESWLILLNALEQLPDKQPLVSHEYDGPLKQLPIPIRNLLFKKITIRPNISLILGAANKVAGNFQAPELKLFSTIVEPAGANLENAILHQEMLDQTRIQTEMELATRVQTQLLPQRTPQLPGLELAAYSRAAFQVGGDFYDFIANRPPTACLRSERAEKTEHALTFTVGDVSGKGMPAALLMAMLRTVLRGKAKEMQTPAPETLLNLTNELLYDDFSELNMFATVFVGQYDNQKHLLYYANDGHAPVIYRPAAGPAVMLVADAPPLGILPESLAERQCLAFAPGDLLVIASDGFTEAENDQAGMFGYERLLALVDQWGACSATELMQRLFTTVKDFAGENPQSDDQTLLILRRTEQHDASN